MNRRGWTVIKSYHSADYRYCVDVFADEDGRFGFAEFRADPEDGGGWTLLRQGSERFDDVRAAHADAAKTVQWMDKVVGGAGH